MIYRLRYNCHVKTTAVVWKVKIVYGIQANQLQSYFLKTVSLLHTSTSYSSTTSPHHLSSFLLKDSYMYDRIPTWNHKYTNYRWHFTPLLEKCVVKPIPKMGPMDEINNTQLLKFLLCLKYWKNSYQTSWWHLLINTVFLAVHNLASTKEVITSNN